MCTSFVPKSLLPSALLTWIPRNRTRWPHLNHVSLDWRPPTDGGSNGWLEDDMQTETYKFVSVTSWSSQAARIEWQQEYSIRSQTDYNGFGHIIDWLRILSLRVETQFLVLEEEDAQIRQWERERILSMPVKGSGPLFS